MLPPALKWVDEGPGPFFLMMITSIAHDPYEVPEWFGKPKVERSDKYVQTIRYTDAFVGKVCEELESRGLADNTVLCVMGDHGVSFRSEDRLAAGCPMTRSFAYPG